MPRVHSTVVSSNHRPGDKVVNMPARQPGADRRLYRRQGRVQLDRWLGRPHLNQEPQCGALFRGDHDVQEGRNEVDVDALLLEVAARSQSL